MGSSFIGIVLAWLVCAALYFPLKAMMESVSLRKKFADAGTLRGRTKADIIAAVGGPNSVSAQPYGKSLLQWSETLPTGAYQIALLFDASGVCEGVTHEHNSQV
jgi:hypothetical protein